MTEQPPEQAEPEQAEPEQAEPEQAEPREQSAAPPVDDVMERRTGVAAADEAAARLADIDGAGLDEHVEIYEDVHRRLQEGLADLDEQ